MDAVKVLPLQINIPLSYGANNHATGQVGQLVNKYCAIVGIGYDSDDPLFSLLNMMRKWQIGARQYVQQDGVTVGLLSPGAAPAVAAAGAVEMWGGSPYFPGSQLMLADGTLVGGMELDPQQVITFDIEDLTGGSAELNSLVLYLYQFPQTPEGLRLAREFNNGRGQIQIVGQSLLQETGTVLTLQEMLTTVSPVHNLPIRRTCMVGCTDDESDAGSDATQLEEGDFRATSLITQFNTEKATSAQAVPSRNIAGHGCLRFPVNIVVDGDNTSKQLIQLTAPSFAADRTHRFGVFFEGIPLQEFKDDPICGQTAI